MKKKSRKVIVSLLVTTTPILVLVALYTINNQSATTDKLTEIQCESIEGTHVCDYTTLFQD